MNPRVNARRLRTILFDETTANTFPSPLPMPPHGSRRHLAQEPDRCRWTCASARRARSNRPIVNLRRRWRFPMVTRCGDRSKSECAEASTRPVNFLEFWPVPERYVAGSGHSYLPVTPRISLRLSMTLYSCRLRHFDEHFRSCVPLNLYRAVFFGTRSFRSPCEQPSKCYQQARAHQFCRSFRLSAKLKFRGAPISRIIKATTLAGGAFI